MSVVCRLLHVLCHRTDVFLQFNVFTLKLHVTSSDDGYDFFQFLVFFLQVFYFAICCHEIFSLKIISSFQLTNNAVSLSHSPVVSCSPIVSFCLDMTPYNVLAS